MFHELPHLLTDPSHWTFEFITDLVFAIPAYILGRMGIKRHDRIHHGKHAAKRLRLPVWAASQRFEPELLQPQFIPPRASLSPKEYDA